MNVYLDTLNIFRLVCVIQGFSIGVFMILTNRQNRAKMLLGLLLVSLSFSILDHFLSASGIYYRHKRLYFMPIYFSWGFGPLLYLYVANLLSKNVKVKALHYLPVAIQILFYSFLVFQSLDFKAWFWQHVHKPYTRFAEYYGMCISVLCYLGLLYKNYRSLIHKIRWVQWMLGSLAVFFAVAIIDPMINIWYQPASMPKFYMITFLLPISTCWLVMAAGFFEQLNTKRQHRINKSFDEDVLQLIRQRIEVEFAYRDAELNLQSLSLALGITANTISKTINQATQKTFSDYINELRIAEVKRRLQREEALKFTILSIAYDAGFNSKTTFNRVFKQYTGLSPKDYLISVEKI